MIKLYQIIIFCLLYSCSSTTSVNSARSPSSVDASKSCYDYVREITNSFIRIHKSKFVQYYDGMNSTLSGNLSTVYRSEWKAKENYKNTYSYLDALYANFAHESAPTQGTVGPEENIKNLIEYIRDKKKIGQIGMRDPPPPEGSDDRTFTYYTKAIIDGSGAKHQIRLRTYLRNLILKDMMLGVPVNGFLETGKISVIRVEKNKFQLIKYNHKGEKAYDRILNVRFLKKELGNKLTFYSAPHAQRLKLEVKTRPHDEILLLGNPKLIGKNYVQKLSIDVDINDISLLFSSANDTLPTLKKLELLKANVKKNQNNSSARVDEIFKILEESYKADPTFFYAKGATEYKRYALEVELPDEIDGVKVKVQTTFDYEMGVVSNYDKNNNFLTPLQSINTSKYIKTDNENDKFHIELKVPKVLVESIEKGNVSSELHYLLKVFANTNVTNEGKFKYIQKNAHH